jgi:hypothetical protein
VDRTLANGRAKPSASTVARLTRTLAEYERLAEEVTMTEDVLSESLFGHRAYAETLLARTRVSRLDWYPTAGSRRPSARARAKHEIRALALRSERGNKCPRDRSAVGQVSAAIQPSLT